MDSQINIKRVWNGKNLKHIFGKIKSTAKRSSTEHKRAGTASCCARIRKDHGTGDTSWLYDLL